MSATKPKLKWEGNFAEVGKWSVTVHEFDGRAWYICLECELPNLLHFQADSDVDYKTKEDAMIAAEQCLLAATADAEKIREALG